MPSLNSRPIQRKFNSIVLGDSVSNSSRTIVLGSNNYVGRDSEGTIISGNNNIFLDTSNALNNLVVGDNNLFYNNTKSNFILGNFNVIGTVTTSPEGVSATTGNSMTSITGITLLNVNNYTATTSDTVYVPNVQFTSTASTLNGISINNIITNNTVKFKELSIGDWDMDAASGVGIAHGLSATEWKTIRGLSFIIRNDSDDQYYQNNANGTTNAFDCYLGVLDSTVINLVRVTGGSFDNVNFNLTPFNRGWITFWYTPD